MCSLHSIDILITLSRIGIKVITVARAIQTAVIAEILVIAIVTKIRKIAADQTKEEA